MIRLAAFDFDGVVLESVDIKTTAFRRLCLPYGEEAAERMVAYHLEHGGVSRFEKLRWFHRTVLGREVGEDELRALGDEFSALVLDEVLRCDFVPGARELLSRLASSGMPLFVVSGTPEGELRDIVARRGLAPLFRGVHGSPATKGELLRDVLERAGVAPEEAVFVGDATTDLHGARDAGVPFVGRVRRGDPDPFPPGTHVVSDLRELDVAWDALSAAPPPVPA